MNTGVSGRLGARLFGAVVVLLLCDPFLALLPFSLSPQKALELNGFSGGVENWRGAVALSPGVSHALGASISRFPPVWGTASGTVLPEYFPPTIELGDDGLVESRVDSGDVVWSLRDRLPHSVVQIVSGDESKACSDYDGFKLRCGGKSYQFVGKYAGTVSGVDIPCVWLHPTDEGELMVRVLDLPKTQRITGYVGLLDGSGKRADVHIEGRFNGRKVFKATVNKDKKFSRLGGRLSKPASGHLELRLRTKDADWRLVCAGIYGLAEAKQ